MSRRKRQWSRRGEERGPRPPWGWLLLGVFLVGGLAAGGWWLWRSGAVTALNPPPATTTARPARALATALPATGTATALPAPSPTRPLPPSPSPTPEVAAPGILLSPGRIAAIDPAGEQTLLATAAGVSFLDRDSLALVADRETPGAALAATLLPAAAGQPQTLLVVTAAGQILREEAGGELRPLIPPAQLVPLNAAFLGPGGRWVAGLAGTARSGSEIRVYDTGTGRLAHILNAHAGRAVQVLFLPDADGEAGPLLLTRGNDGRARLWQRDGWGERTLPERLSWGAGPLAATSSEERSSPLLAAAHADGSVSLWNTRTWQPLPLEAEPAAAVRALALGDGGRLLAAARADGTLTLWQEGTEEPRTCPLAATQLAFLPGADGALLGQGPDGRLYLWDVDADDCPEAARAASDPDRPYPARLDFLAAGPPGRLAAAGETGRVFLWDLAAGTVSRTIDPGGPVGALAYGPGGVVAVGGEAGPLLWDGAGGAFLYDLGGHVISRPGAANVTALAFSPATAGETAGVLASADRSGLMKLWRVRDGATLRNLLPEQRAPVTSLSFSADGYYLLAGGGAGVAVWQPRRGEWLRALAPAGKAVAAPALPGAGQAQWALVALLRGPQITLYDEEGRALRSVQAVPLGTDPAPPAATAAAFVRPPAGAAALPLLLATGHADGAIRLWDPERGDLLALLPPHPGPITALAVESCTLFSAAAPGTLRADAVCGD